MSILMGAPCVLSQHFLQAFRKHPSPWDEAHYSRTSSYTLLSHHRWHSSLHDPYGFHLRGKETSPDSRISFLKHPTPFYISLFQPSISATSALLFEDHIFLPRSTYLPEY